MKTFTALTFLFLTLPGTAMAGESGSADFWNMSLQSYFILIREGVEALLIITALIAWLHRSGAEDKTSVIYYGVGWAVAAALATAYILQTVLQLSGEMREAFEGAAMLLASAVLFYVSYWLIARSQAGAWQAYIRGSVDKAISRNSQFSLGMAAFLAVYREGAETVLFYQALIAGAPDQSGAIASGFIVAVLCLALIYWLIRSVSLRLPMGLFFSVTAGLLLLLAFIYAGKGVHELQEAHLISETMISGFPKIRWLGLYPTLETIAAQMFILIPVCAGLLKLAVGKQKHLAG